MPSAKLLIDKTSPALKRQPTKLVGRPVANHLDLGPKYAVADLGFQVVHPGDAWQVAYEAVRDTPGHFFEPDYPSGFQVSKDPLRGLTAGTNGDFGIANDQVGTAIRGEGFAWHRGDKYSQLERARKDADQHASTSVRVAICDVGFDLNHETFPAERAQMDLARNFVADAAPNNVWDRNVQGWLQSPGHGTATLALLAAGKLPADILAAEQVPADCYLGAVPQAQVVPLRIATSVVLLETSTFVAAMEYLLDLHARGTRIDVVSMSMGGAGSAAWADVINRAYEAGIIVVSAAGNNLPLPLLGFPRSPTSTVFPARFNRVISTTGVTAALTPYATLKELEMRGNYGPPSKMRTAIAAFTPNIPWAEFGSPRIIDLDGQGTSAATPQIAGAAALYLLKYKPLMEGWAPWQVVEAVRHALWSTALKNGRETALYLGAGVLRAFDALQIRPVKTDKREEADTAFLPALKVLFGDLPFGLAKGQDQSNARKMLWLETVQLIHRDPNVEKAVSDPDSGRITPQERRDLTAAILDSPFASETLKQALDRNYQPKEPMRPRRLIDPPPPADEPQPPKPVNRLLQAYAFDPSHARSFQTYQANRVIVDVPWEELKPGPCGEYLQVVDHDAPSGCFYPPVDLDHKHLLATNGLAPSPGNPQFHQQMVYAAAMRTIRNFELALGRRVQWSPDMKEGSHDDRKFVPQLRIYPHALRERNAYYDPRKKALLFGYFASAPADPADLPPGSTTFACLSHDVIAHETTHAILDGIYRNFNNPTNPDQLAFHEAFADIVALFQHFSIQSVVEAYVRKTRGDLRQVNDALLEMAREFGLATGLHAALRSALGGGADPRTGLPDYGALAQTTEIHDRGAILVAAVFDAFLNIYRAKIADLSRIATGGTGILPQGEIHPDLVRRFASEASQLASQFLLLCIRALDYCTAVDLTFADYLQALITADHDLVPDDPWGYRVALAESFRKRAILPKSVGSFGEESLLWRPAEAVTNVEDLRQLLHKIRPELDHFLTEAARIDPGPGQHPIPEAGVRRQLFDLARNTRKNVHDKLENLFRDLRPGQQGNIAGALHLKLDPTNPRFEVQTLAFAERQGPNGRAISQFVISLVQQDHDLWSGATILLDRGDQPLRYIIYKDALSESRRKRSREFALRQLANENPYFRVSRGQQLALIHATGGMPRE